MARRARIIEEDVEVPTHVKFAVLAVVREALVEMPERASQVVVTRRRRQVMAGAFPYVDVHKVSDDELLDQLREDIKQTLERLS
jgi:DNA-directed RNA polymerase subunit K/omega